MQVTPIGALLIWIGLLAFVTKSRALLYLAVFFAPFTYTAVVVVRGASSTRALPAWLWFGGLALLRAVGMILGGEQLRAHRDVRSVLRAGGVFALVAAGSLVVPLAIRGTYAVPSPSPEDYGALRSVVLSANNFIVLLPMLTAFGLIWLLAARCSEGPELLGLLRAMILGVTVVALIGFWEYLHIRISIPYPQQFLRSLDATRVESKIHGTGLSRLASVTPESSVLAQIVVVGIPVLLIAKLKRTVIFNRQVDTMALLIIATVLLLCGSSSALIGFAVAAAGSVVSIVAFRHHSIGERFRAGASLGALIVAAKIVYDASPAAQGLVSVLLLKKRLSDSYFIRTRVTDAAWNTFHDFPFTGVGIGNSSSYDMLGRVLSCVGLIGAAALCVFLALILSRAWNLAWGALSEGSPEQAVYAQGLLVGVAAQLVLAQLAGFEWEFAHLWISLGMTIALIAANASAQDGQHATTGPEMAKVISG